jgi:hypothetical protein
MSRLIFNADTLGGTTTLSSADAVGNFTITVPAATGTMSIKDASGDATFRNLTLTGAVLAGAWNGSTIAVAYGGTGVTTLTGYVKGNGTSAMTASPTIPNTDITGLGTMSVQGSDAVTITGGTANGLTIGASNPAAATVTTLRINSTLSMAGNTGTAGQVLTSNGASAATWQNIAGSGTVTSVDVSGGTTGLTTSGGPITGSGTITLAGTLAIANGGTGATSAANALTALGAYPATNPSGFGVGTVTSVAGTGTVNGLTLTGTVTSSGSLTLGGTLDLSSPPAIGGTAAAAVTGTTITASTRFVGPFFDASGSGGGALRTSSSAACLQWGAGGGVNLTLDGAFNMNPANATISIAPTGTGTLTVAPATAGTINNMSLGVTTPAEVKVTVGWAANTALTDAATVAWDTTNQVATFTFVSTNRTMGAPTNLKNGAFYALAVIQNGGSNTLTWNSVFKWAAGTAPTLSTAAGAKDYFTFRSDGTNLYQQGISQAVA